MNGIIRDVYIDGVKLTTVVIDGEVAIPDMEEYAAEVDRAVLEASKCNPIADIKPKSYLKMVGNTLKKVCSNETIIDTRKK